jgi:predicted metal-binding transcription factor (methanogenesis marker protein 9)
MLKQSLGLKEEARAFLSDMEYVDLQLTLAKEVLSKARFTKKKEEKISYLLVLSSIVSDCLEALGVEKWKNQLK